MTAIEFCGVALVAAVAVVRLRSWARWSATWRLVESRRDGEPALDTARAWQSPDEPSPKRQSGGCGAA